jgi:hypothetical protein
MGPLDDSDHFGTSIAGLGDFDEDGLDELAIGAIGDDDGGNGKGAVWILSLNSNGTVRGDHQKISDASGGMEGNIEYDVGFGRSTASLGDLDGDGFGDLAVGAHMDSDGGTYCGAVWMLYLHADGSVRTHQRISATEGGLEGNIDPFDHFGFSITRLGDLDGDGVTDLVVGAPWDDDGYWERGAVWILFSADCTGGSVNDLAGPRTNVLYVNGASRTPAVEESETIWGAIVPPPGGGNGKFVVHANLDAPTRESMTPLPGQLGTACFPMLLAQGATPAAIWNNIGKVDQVGASRYFDGMPIDDPERAPTFFLYLGGGDPVNLPAGTTVTFQGILVDPGSSSPKSASVTNAAVLTVL